MSQQEPNDEYKSSFGKAAFAGSSDLLERAGVAHELGNLIQIASSAVNIIARNSKADDTWALDPVILGARTSLERASALVRQSIRRGDGSGTELDHVDIGGSLAEIRRLVQYTWAPKYSFETKFGDPLPMVRCAPLGLQGAILNLALNARDAMPDGGVISIEAAAVFSGTMESVVELSVSDTGLGMTPETMARAFDPFFTTKSTGLGGVGLPMVKRFVQEAGGELKMVSEYGRGTTVTLRLRAIR